MKSILYLVGTLLLMAGVLYGASIAGVPQTWLIVIGMVLGGLGIMGAVRSSGATTRAVETTTTPGRPATTRETSVSTDAL